VRALAFLSLLVAAPLLAQPAPRVTVALNPQQPTVGDRVEAVLILKVPTAELAGEPRFPVWSGKWGEAEVLLDGPGQKVSEEGGVATYQQRLVIAAFRPGKVVLPATNVAIPQKNGTVQAATPAGLGLDVRSVLPPGEERPAPKPPAAPRKLPLGERFWWTFAALLALCLAAGWLLWRRRRATGEGTAMVPVLEPFEELTGELDRLTAEPSAVLVHTRLSMALRRYLGRVLPFPAVESTTSEVLRQLHSRRMPGPLVRQTVDLLRACDMVKFARQEVGEARAKERLDAARKLGRDYETLFAPREPETLEKAG
jgi:hypothetical protein